MDTTLHTARKTAIGKLKPHPRNYRSHPDDQIEQLIASLTEHGMYRSVVVANDWTILAGHGITEAARRIGLDKIPVIKLEIEPDSAQALKLLAADNMIDHMAVDDDRMLTELLREIGEADALLGTGFDAEKLAALTMITRPAEEIEDFDAAAEWVGLPDFENDPQHLQLVLTFQSEDMRAEVIEKLGLHITSKIRKVWSAHYPSEDGRQDLRSVRFET